MASPDPLAFFRLKPIRAARVSEISETTAAAPVPPEERVNFHIGNPLQDARLTSAFLRIALGIDFDRLELQDTTPEAVMEHLGWDPADRPKLDFLIRTIQKSIPYAPRGGYARKSPHALIRYFCTWLEKQQEPLAYDLGEQSARREIILASGGIHETLRVILSALNDYLHRTPARILCYHHEIRLPQSSFPNLHILPLAEDERTAREQVEQHLRQQPETPTFLLIGALLGSLLGEETRRHLRLLSTQAPLFFIEANNAPNHLSLAREARLVQRVIRLLTPAIFAQRLESLSPVFILGNADFLGVIENVHFQLKGTPSASEVELLTYLLEQNLAEVDPPATTIGARTIVPLRDTTPPRDILPLQTGGDERAPLSNLATRISDHIAARLEATTQTAEHYLAALDAKTEAVSRIASAHWKAGLLDELAALDSLQLLEALAEHAHEPAWRQSLERSFLSAFVSHQPQYQPDACLVASGSSRTALGMLGFHCGITDVVIADLSWSYEQCFPHVHAVPLTRDLALDVEAMIAKLKQLCQHDPTWPEHGAVAINNPHNATGRIFDPAALAKLIAYCLEHDIYVIDDLAYQNVAPVDGLPEILTARQIADGLVRDGKLSQPRGDRLITVHSMSKTDCLAGARLAVVEIRQASLRLRFQAVNALVQPNLAAILVCYLFYRSRAPSVRAYWGLRNRLFQERTQALLSAVQQLPPDRNPFGLEILPPAGSMYPLLHIQRLPGGLSLDWLASSLARRGIGLLPLATFARTEAGFEAGRSTFRLTLGGSDPAETLSAKTRRLLIDLNRMIAEEQARYNRNRLDFRVSPPSLASFAGAAGRDQIGAFSSEPLRRWEEISQEIQRFFQDPRRLRPLSRLPHVDFSAMQTELLQSYLPERLETFRTRCLERALISDESLRRALREDRGWLSDRLDGEFMKDSLARRQELFRSRSYDRTVHPTQRYSLQAEMAFDALIERVIAQQPVEPGLAQAAARELLEEFIGRNVSIDSQHEADEILLDFDSLAAGEAYAELFANTSLSPFLSFWSDWDGSNRPSGQGHRLIASAVMTNVARMAHILRLLRQADPQIEMDAQLLSQLDQLPQQRQRFTALLNHITQLTHQLEGRYHGILPFSVEATPFQRFTTRLHLRRDPARVLWQHNDHYEQKMLELRRQRRSMLETYFALNKRLRKQLHALIPAIQANRTHAPLLRAAVGYRDLLQRIAITPRIHEGMITGRDPFAIDTTVYNLHEINAIAGQYGNPGMALALQISLSTRAEALIALDRKMRNQAEQSHREHPEAELPPIWLIPLFEELSAVENIPAYLDRAWDYAAQSRRTDQSPQERFAEVCSEVFIAGSDLSQQIGQAHAAYKYLKAKYQLQLWLAEHGVAEAVRVKFGSGEPMQRQGGYYSPVAGQPAFLASKSNLQRLSAHLPAAARKSTAYAVTPLQGVFLGGDLRTFQSSLSEQLRYLPVQDFADLLYHVRQAQQAHHGNLVRAAETITETRLGARSRSLQELERMTIGTSDALYEGFLLELTEHFRHILYGRAEDVVGIHIISYFIGRSIPQLRDRPTSRRRAATGGDRGQQILADIAEIIPLSRQGSLLRAIAHNQAQTCVLGVNQLTTGLFRALEYHAQKNFAEAERERLVAERILPRLPVYEILHTLRLYQDCKGELIQRIEPAFPAGNSAFAALREDSAAMLRLLPLFQQELLRRHGLNVSDFLSEGVFIPALLPTLRPDLAVLLQPDLFNTHLERLLAHTNGTVEPAWRDQAARLLRLPEQIRAWRQVLWQALGESIYQRVQSFTELATALYAFSTARPTPPPVSTPQRAQIPSALTGFIRSARMDDEMRPFLVGAVEALSAYTQGSLEVPVSIIRALQDVERIALIEESALPPEQQDVLRCAVLHIARLAGENG